MLSALRPASGLADLRPGKLDSFAFGLWSAGDCHALEAFHAMVARGLMKCHSKSCSASLGGAHCETITMSFVPGWRGRFEKVQVEIWEPRGGRGIWGGVAHNSTCSTCTLYSCSGTLGCLMVGRNQAMG